MWRDDAATVMASACHRDIKGGLSMDTSNEMFVKAANPHSWMLAADNLHAQALHLYEQRGKSTLTHIDYQSDVTTAWDGINKSVFLLGGFALENAIKAFLVYENPSWISNGSIARPLRSHKLATLRAKSTKIPSVEGDIYVLQRFEEGLESWARYPCGLTFDEPTSEGALQPDLWEGYVRIMRAYGESLCALLSEEWRGPHGFYGRYKISGSFLRGD